MAVISERISYNGDKCKCKKDLLFNKITKADTTYKLPEVIPQVSIGFRHSSKVTLCYFQIRQKLRIGVTICGNDEFDAFEGEKVAMKRAMDQHKIGKMVRMAFWAQLFVTRHRVVDEDALSTLNWFKSDKVSFNMM